MKSRCWKPPASVAVANGPEMMVYPEGVHYTNLTVDDIPFLVEEHFLKGRIAKKFLEPEMS